MRRAISIAFGLIATLAALSILGSAANAQDEGSSLNTPTEITAIDATSANEPEMVVFGVDPNSDASELSIEVAGDPAQITTVRSATEAGWPTQIVFVVDVHNRRVADGTLDQAKLAIANLVEEMPAETSVSIVSAGSSAQKQTPFTANKERLVSEVRALPAESGAAIFDGVAMAGRLFDQNPDAIRSVVVFAGGPDTASQLDDNGAAARLIQSGAQLVTVRSGDSNVTGLNEAVGGAELVTSESLSIADAMESGFATASDRLLVSFVGPEADGPRLNLELTAGGDKTKASYPVGIETANRLQLAPQAEQSRLNLNFFGNPIMLYLFIGLAFVGISLAIWSIGSMFVGQSNLDNMLARYDSGSDEMDDAEVNEMLVQSALVQRAVDMTESFADKQGFLSRMESLLERANLPIRAGEALFFAGLLSLFVFAVVWIVGNSFLFAVLFSLIALGASYGLVQFLARRRLKKFEGQLPDALQLLAGTLRAGYSLPQGLESVSQEISDPMGEELRRAMTEAQLGRELEPALSGVAERLDSPDFAWAVMAIGIQREVGGNLSELLMTVSETMIQRERLRREVNALTAEGRMSAGILSFLPPGLAAVMFIMNPDYIGTLFESAMGWALVGLAVVLGLVGLAWMKKVITIDA